MKPACETDHCSNMFMSHMFVYCERKNLAHESRFLNYAACSHLFMNNIKNLRTMFFPPGSLGPSKTKSCVEQYSYFRPYMYNFFNLFIPTVRASDSVGATDDLGALERRKEKIKNMLSNETKHDRLHRMFSLNEYGLLSPEMKYIIQGTYASFAFGSLIGAISSMSKTKDNFLRQNVATPYEHEHLARRQLTDRMTLNAIKQGFKNGAKLSFATSVYLFVTMTAATYNNKVTIFEHIGGGALMGSMARINYGPKGMAVAGGLGAFLGLCTGGVLLILMKLSGITFEEFRFFQHEYFAPELQSKMKKGTDDRQHSD